MKCNIALLIVSLLLMSFLPKPSIGETPQVHVFNKFSNQEIRLDCFYEEIFEADHKSMISLGRKILERGKGGTWNMEGEEATRTHKCKVLWRIESFEFETFFFTVYEYSWNDRDDFIAATVNPDTGNQEIIFVLMDHGVQLYNFSSRVYVDQCLWRGILTYGPPS